MTKPRRDRGITGHEQRNDRDQWFTPKYIIDALGPFDLDPCTSDARPWPTAESHWTRVVNGLTKPWPVGARVWLNPPYKREEIKRWLELMAKHGIGTALVFARTETEAFHCWVWPYAWGLLFLRGRLRFIDAAGALGAYTGGAPSVLIAYGASDYRRLENCGLPGRVVCLR